MAKVYNKGIVSPKGFDMSTPEPVDQRTIVEYKADLYVLKNAYIGIMVQVLESIDAKILREFKYVGGDQTLEASWEEVTGGTSEGGTPISGSNKFTSFVFIRATEKPDTPIGGDYDNPVPPGWSDTIPAGTLSVWMSSAILTEGETALPVWNDPMAVGDSEGIEFEYCKYSDVPPVNIEPNGQPQAPLEDIGQRTYWHDPSTVDDDWMAIGTRIEGAYPTTWSIIQIGGEKGDDGEQGLDGRAYKAANVFTRSSTLDLGNSVVTGGSFDIPYPTRTQINGVTYPTVAWSDGIPSGTEKVFMSTFVYNDVDNQVPSDLNVWTTPSPITDTATDDFEFSDQVAQPQTPDIDPSAWSDVMGVNTIWMAHRSIDNGIFGAWTITKIKGETGDTGKGLDIQGRDTPCNILTTHAATAALYDVWLASEDATIAEMLTCSGFTMDVDAVTNDAFLFVGAGAGEGGSAWDNIGGVTGTDGVSFKQSFVYRRETTQPVTPSGGSFVSPEPAGWTDGIPAGTDTLWVSRRFFSQPDTGTLADWSIPELATDTIEYDFEYAGMQPNDPVVPASPPDPIWHNAPLVTDYWAAKAKKVNGITDVSSWEIWRIKGEKGDDGQDGLPSFLSSVYIKTNTDISAVTVSGGTYVSPIPTTTADGKNWSDGIPAGDGAIWFTQVKFDTDDNGTPTKQWPAPTLIADSTTVEYQFSSSNSKPTGNPTPVDGEFSWYDNAEDTVGDPIWMAIGSLRNGEWPTVWDIVQIKGETGETGSEARTYIPSTMFCRSDAAGMDLLDVHGKYLTLSGNQFIIDGTDPLQEIPGSGGYRYIFTDGIPERTETFPNNARQVWMIQHVFNSVDDLDAINIVNWGKPSLLQDAAGVDYQYHRGDSPVGTGAGTKPSEPTGSGVDPDTAGWWSSPSAAGLEAIGGAYWLAQKNWSEGPAAQWVIYQIRGEDGADGTGITPANPPSTPSGLCVQMEGYNERLTWLASTSDPVTTIDHYEIREIAQGLGTFTSTTTSLVINTLDGVLRPTYNFEVRSVDALNNKSAWSAGLNYLPAEDGLFAIIDKQFYTDCTLSNIVIGFPLVLGSDGQFLNKIQYVYERGPSTCNGILAPFTTGDYVMLGVISTDLTPAYYRISVDSAGGATYIGPC